MDTYTVQISKTALLDLRSIRDYIAEELYSPENASQQYDKIVQKIFSLKTFPKRHPVVFHINDKHYHRIMADNYSIIYEIHKDSVFIVRIAYTASNIWELLQEF